MKHLTERDDIRLTSSFVQAKYGTNYMESDDQTLHNDSWNASSLLWPRRTRPTSDCSASSTSPTSTGTRPRHAWSTAQSTSGAPLLDSSGKASYPQDTYPSYYDREVSIEAAAGDLLLFTGDLVHRGTAFRKPEGMRAALFFNLHTQAAIWTDKHVWSSRPAASGWPVFAELVAELSIEQRELLGFPRPGDPYWNEETLVGVQRLYPDMDMEPYARDVTAMYSRSFETLIGRTLHPDRPDPPLRTVVPLLHPGSPTEMSIAFSSDGQARLRYLFVPASSAEENWRIANDFVDHWANADLPSTAAASH